MMKKYIYLTVVVVILAVVAWIWISNTTDIKINHSETVTTPSRIESIKEIGEWEFLSIYDEELVDTVAETRRIWPLPPARRQLTRIYSGTMRLGFDLQKDVSKDWIVERGDTVDVTLPPIRLLDEEFVDEAAARSVIETGKWSAADRSAMYGMAVRKIKKNCMTPDNLQRARESARQQMEQLLRSMGFKVITVRFEDKNL